MSFRYPTQQVQLYQISSPITPHALQHRLLPNTLLQTSHCLCVCVCVVGMKRPPKIMGVWQSTPGCEAITASSLSSCHLHSLGPPFPSPPPLTVASRLPPIISTSVTIRVTLDGPSLLPLSPYTCVCLPPIIPSSPVSI